MFKKDKDDVADGAVTQASLVPSASRTLLNQETVDILDRMDSFFIQQRIRMLEAATW